MIKRFIISLFLSWCSILIWAQNATVTVRVLSNDIQKIAIQNHFTSAKTYKVTRQKCVINFPVTVKQIYFLSTDLSDKVFFPIVLAPNEDIEISLTQDSVIRLISVKGSAEIQHTVNFMDRFFKLQAELARMEQVFQKASPVLKDDIALKYNALYENIQEQLSKIVLSEPLLLANVILVNVFDYKEYPLLYHQIRTDLIELYPNNVYVKNLFNLEESSKYKNIVVQDYNQKKIPLSKLEGNYIILHFWASWSPPSRAENKALTQIYSDFKKDGLKIYSVSVDADKMSWIEAIEKDKMYWTTHVSDLLAWQSYIVQLYGVKKLPAYFLIDKQGYIVGADISLPELRSLLEDVFDFKKDF